MDELAPINSLVLGFAVALAPLGGLMALLNLRDRRQTRVLHLVLDQHRSRSLRGHIAVRVRCGLFLPRCVVRVYIAACSRDEVWEIATRLSQCLASRVRLDVTGCLDQDCLVTFTVKRTSKDRLPRRVPAHGQEALSASPQ